MEISSAFDGGNIAVLGYDEPHIARLKIEKDNQSDFLQWFYFRLSGARESACTLVIENAHEAAYLDGWTDYQAVASYDRETWFRVPTNYDGKTLTISHKPEADLVWYAYFAPYGMERHADLVATANAHPRTSVRTLCKTCDGQDLDLIEIGGDDIEAPLQIWFIARQHPGETMAEWWMEGLLERLLDADDPVARSLLGRARVHIVPNMNPDGSRRGHLRTNAVGVNLNRVWKDPSKEASPEVYWVRREMEKTGVDFHLDVHGDEALPYNFLAGFEGIPSLKAEKQALFSRYQKLLAQITPDFQTEHGYPLEASHTSDLKKCTDWVAERFQCLAMTLEMPFKDNADLPDAVFGWSPERCKHMARSCVDALYLILDDLK